MPDPVSAVAVGSAGAGLISSRQGTRAASKAADAQSRSAQLGIDEQRRQFDAVLQLLSPYNSAGNEAIESMRLFTGQGDPQQQQAAIDAIQAQPEFLSLVQQGEDAILSNASATGGLRGGNTQSAFAQYRPSVLSGLINQQYQRLGGLANMGQNSAAMVGSAGQGMANNVANLYGQSGAAQAGAALAAGQAQQQAIGGIGNAAAWWQAQQRPSTQSGYTGNSLFGNSWGF